MNAGVECDYEVESNNTSDNITGVISEDVNEFNMVKI